MSSFTPTTLNEQSKASRPTKTAQLTACSVIIGHNAFDCISEFRRIAYGGIPISFSVGRELAASRLEIATSSAEMAANDKTASLHDTVYAPFHL